METAMERCMRESEAEQMTTNKKKVDSFAVLPDDLLLDILQRLPRDIRRHRTRFVCKRWFSLTTNWIFLDHDSVLVQSSFHESFKVRLMDTSEEKQGLQMKERDLEIPHIGRIKSWCNEFLLIKGFTDTLFIYNLLTRQGSFTPPFSTSCRGHSVYTCATGLFYDKFKGVYKVVHVFVGQEEIQCEILILKNRSSITSCNSLKWKKIRIPRYTDYDTFYWGDSVSVQGRYCHWDVKNHKYLVSMDTLNEKFRQTLLPGSDLFSWHTRYFIVEMSGFLTLFNEGSEDKVNIWRLKDYERTNWEKLMSITISSDVWSSIYISTRLSYPVIWVIKKRFIIFQKRTLSAYELYSYDLKSKVVRRLEVDFASDNRFVVHTTSCMLSESPK